LEEQQHRNALPRGFQLFEYQIESVLGKPGGFGITYLATDTHLRQSVAIKEYLPTDFAIREGVSTVYVRSSSYEDSFDWGLKCFIEEARTLAKFNHPNIVRVSRFFEAHGTAYMVMEYQKGQSLTDYLKQQRILTEDELLAIVIPLLDGLTEIHLAGFLHRDIKPNNIYIREDKTPVLLDFGSARYAVGQKSRSVTSIVTPGYAPLEQYDNEISDQGPWTDIYALGAVMYCAISGEAPPAATRRVMKDPMIPAVQIGKGKYDNNLLQAIDWSLQLSEEDRPRTVEQWRDKMLTPTRSPSLLNNSKKEILGRHWWFINIIGGVVILLLTITVGILLHKNFLYIAEKEAAIARIQSDAAAKLANEQQLRLVVEKQLSTEKKRREKAESDLLVARTLIEKIRRFDPQVVSSYDAPKYYDVTNVEPNDVLNIREFPGYFNNKVAEIAPTQKCLKFLGKYRILKTQLWVKIEYQKTPGWVNSAFLVENSSCNQGEKEIEENQ
jgi:serine/threonine protein kinase